MKNHKEQVKDHPLLFSARFGLALVAFFGGVCTYAIRTNMSVAMVCMVNHTAILPPDKVNTTRAPNTGEDGPFAWSRDLQGIIHGSFFWGYILTQMPGGFVAEHVGGKIVYGTSMLLCGLATMLIPVAAKASPYALMAARAAQGLAQGVMFPCMHTMWARWAPPNERGKLMTVTSSGVPFGTVLAMSVSGLLCTSAIKWEGIFYVFGGVSLVWIFWWVFGAYNSPAVHPRVSQEERDYIEDRIGSNLKIQRKNIKTPWLKIVTSMPVWAIIVADTTASWLSYTLLTNIPNYMRDVLKFDIKSNGFYSAVPYIVLWAVRMIAAFIADELVARGILSTRNVRKLMFGIGLTIPSAFLIGTGFVGGNNYQLAVAMLALGTGLSGFVMMGVFVNHLDIAPPFAGTLFGISNTFGTATGIAAPYVVAIMTRQGTRQQWQNVFYLTSGINVFGALFFAIFADGEIQEWVKPYMTKKDEDTEEAVIEGDDIAMVATTNQISMKDVYSIENSTMGGTEKTGYDNAVFVPPPQYKQVIDPARLTEL